MLLIHSEILFYPHLTPSPGAWSSGILPETPGQELQEGWDVLILNMALATDELRVASEA